MIAPGLLRRAFSRGAQWRLLLASVVAFALPTALVLSPISRVLGRLLDAHPQAAQWIKGFDGLFLVDLLKQLGNPESGLALQSGVTGTLLTLLFVAPLVAGFSLAAAGLDAPLKLRGLFTGSAQVYGRLLRFTAFSLIPLGLFAIPGALFFRLAGKVSEKAVTDAAASSATRWAAIGFVLFFLAGQTVADCGRALFAAEPHRRSAFFATIAGFRLFFRRPLRALVIGLSTWLFALVFAAVLLRLRLFIPQQSGVAVALAFVAAQLAVAAVLFGRSARLIGLVELAQADAAKRAQKAAKRAQAAAEITAALAVPTGFEMAPPKTSPPPPQLVQEPMPEAAPATEAAGPVVQGAVPGVAPAAASPEGAPMAPRDRKDSKNPSERADEGIVSPVSVPPKR